MFYAIYFVRKSYISFGLLFGYKISFFIIYYKGEGRLGSAQGQNPHSTHPAAIGIYNIQFTKNYNIQLYFI